MVERQVRDRGITDVRVLAAMATVPRERFVDVDLADTAYADRPLPIEEGQTISQPFKWWIWRNRARLADSGVQLRLGRDGLWYRFVQGSRVWEPDSTGAADPGALVASLVEAGEADEAARETSLSWGVSRATTRFARTS